MNGEPRWVEAVVRRRRVPWWRQTMEVPVWLLLLLLGAGTFYYVLSVWP